MDYKSFRVDTLPPTLYYIPEFLTPSEETRLLECIGRTPKVKWTQLSNRRLQNWGGVPHPKGMIQEPLPEWLGSVVERVNGTGAFSDSGCDRGANHVLLNEYLPGQGIMPHTDGDLFHPLISTVTLGSHAVLNYYEPPPKDGQDSISSLQERLRHRVLLERRSLLLVKDDLYRHFLHGIDESEEDVVTADLVNSRDAEGTVLKRGTRVSLTIRNVPKTSRVKLKLGR